MLPEVVREGSEKFNAFPASLFNLTSLLAEFEEVFA